MMIQALSSSLSIPHVGIAAYEDGHRTFYSLGQWNALAMKPTALGVFVNDGAAQFIIHSEVSNDRGLVSWPDNTELSGVTTATSGNDAKLDFNGAANTAALISHLDNGDIGSALLPWVRSIMSSDGAQAYIPGLGEMDAILRHVADVNACRVVLNQSTFDFPDSIYYSSTLAYVYGSYNYCWFFYRGNVDMLWRGSGYRAIAIFQLFIQ